ncbi:MAG: hypothetical protein PHE55_12540 [Methylococcaceae bacterium]|nr:hypothetical protein [Methylococcaceae bacterium]
MKSGFNHHLLTVLAGILLALVIVNIVLNTGNLERQQEVNNRQVYIQQAQQLDALYREMVKAIADLSVSRNDAQLRDLLAGQGLTVNPNPKPAEEGSPREGVEPKERPSRNVPSARDRETRPSR